MWRSLPFVIVLALLGCAKSTPPRPTEKQPAAKPVPTLENVKYPSGKATVSGFLCHPTTEGPFPAVLMIPDRMGLNEGIKKQAYRLSQDEYVVLVVDLYRGAVPKTAQEAERLERELPKERVLDDLKAAIDYLAHRDDVRESTMGALGFGLGGGYALEAALRDPRLRAVVVCYSPLPSDSKHLESLKGSVLYILAGKDKNVTPDSIEPFRKAMANAGKHLEGIRVYRDCPYGFLDQANWPIYGEPPLQDVVDAWKLIERYLDKELR